MWSALAESWLMCRTTRCRRRVKLRVLRLWSRHLFEGAGHLGEFVQVAQAFRRGCGLPGLFDLRQPDVHHVDGNVVSLWEARYSRGRSGELRATTGAAMHTAREQLPAATELSATISAYSGAVGVVRCTQPHHPAPPAGGNLPMITTSTAPPWLRRSDQAVTRARTMLQPHRAVVIDCETTDLPGALNGNVGY